MSVFEVVIGVMTALAAFGGALAIWYELHRTKQISRATFVMNLDDLFQRHDEIYGALNELEHKRSDQTVESDTVRAELISSRSELAEVTSYLTFFEAVYRLLRAKLIQIDELDDLYGYRFFLAVHNREIQEKELVPDRDHYRTVFMLYREWVGYRAKAAQSYADPRNIGERALTDIDELQDAEELSDVADLWKRWDQ